MKKVLTIIIIVLVLLVGFYVINSSRRDGSPIVGENPAGEADPSRMTLDMTTWKWISATEGGRDIKPNKADVFTMAFKKDGTFTATTDCNQMGGSYAAADGQIMLSDIFSTKMFCQDSQEAVFAGFLRDVKTYEFTSRGELVLGLGSGGKMVLR